MTDPAPPLLMALDRHPDSGGGWEQHCEANHRSVGFVDCDPWRSCFWHPALQLFLVDYVDDFKLVGSTATLSEGWR